MVGKGERVSRSSRGIPTLVAAFGLTALLVAFATLAEALLRPSAEVAGAAGSFHAYVVVGEAIAAGLLALLVLAIRDRRERKAAQRHEQDLRRSRLISSLGLAGLGAGEPASVLQEMAEIVRHDLGASAVGLWIPTAEGNPWTLLAGAGLLAESPGAEVAARSWGPASLAQASAPLVPFTPEWISGEVHPAILLDPALFLSLDASPDYPAKLSIHGRRGLEPDEEERVRGSAPVLASSLRRQRRNRVRDVFREVAQRLILTPSETASLGEALESLRKMHGWKAAELWAAPEDPSSDWRLVAWRASEEAAEAFARAGAEIPGEGTASLLPGAVRDLQEPAWQPGLESLSGFSRARLAAEAGLRTAFGLPLRGPGGPTGVLVLYGPSLEPPSAAARSDLAGLVALLSAGLDRVAESEHRDRTARELADSLLQAPLGISEWDGSGVIRSTNDEGLRMLGVDRKEYVGRHFAEFLADAHARKILTDAIRGGGSVSSLEARLIRKDGSTVYTLLDMRPLSEDGGEAGVRVFTREISTIRAQAEALLESKRELERRLSERTDELVRLNQDRLRDIARRLEAEEEIDRRERRFQSLIAHVADLVIILDGGGQFTFLSPSAAHTLGREVEDLLGASLYDYVHPDDLVSAMQWVTRMADEPGESHRLDFRLRHATGGWGLVEAVGKGIFDKGSPSSIVINARDLAERVESRVALQESEERFNLLMRSVANCAIFLVDTDGRVASWNEAAAGLLGYSPEEIIGQSFAKFFTPEDLQEGRPERYLETARRQGRFITQGWRVRNDGSRFWAEGSLTALYDDRQQFRGFAKFIRDITDRTEVETKLRRSEDLLSEAQRIARVGGIEWDPERDEVNWSGEISRVFGLAEEESRPPLESFLRHVHPDDRAKMEEAFRRGLENHRAFELEVRTARPEGDEWAVHIRGRAEVDPTGKPARLIAVGQDITGRKKMEDALRTQTELYMSVLVAQSELGEGVLLAEGDTILYANLALGSLLGTEAANALSLRGLLNKIDPERHSSLRKDLEDRIHRALPPARGESALKRSDGSQIHIGYTIMAAGGPDRSRTFALLRDETERMRALEALRASRERLRQFSSELERAREEESARISREIHDELGQQLTGLKLDLSWLAGRLEASGQAGDAALLEKARAMSTLVDTTVEQVRRIASELRPGVLDDLGLSAALEWQAAEFESRTGIRCRLDCDPKAESVPPDHASAMFRIFQEALTNVARHAQARKVDVRLRIQDGALTLTIEDDGRGITEEEIRSSTSLGLLGLRERASLLGGETTIRRRNSKGTIVHVSLPLTPEAAGKATS